jgi:hypothetical protein
MPSYRGGSIALRSQGTPYLGPPAVEPVLSTAAASLGKGSYRGASKAIHVPCPNRDTFSRIVPPHPGPPVKINNETPNYVRYFPSTPDNAWGDSELCGIGWTEDWSSTIDGPYAESVDGEVGVIDLLATGRGPKHVIASPCIFPTGYYDAAESAEAGKRLGPTDAIYISYDFMYDQARTPGGGHPGVYMSWWLTASLGFDDPPGNGNGITASYGPRLDGPIVNWAPLLPSSPAISPSQYNSSFMDIEFETFEEYFAATHSAATQADIDKGWYYPQAQTAYGDSDFALSFLLTDNRMPTRKIGSDKYKPTGYEYHYGELSFCNGKWIHVTVRVDVYGTYATAKFRDEEGPTVIWGEWSDEPVCPMGEVGLPASDYSVASVGETEFVPPFNAYGCLEVDGLADPSYPSTDDAPDSAFFYYDNLKFGCEEVELTYGENVFSSSSPSYRGTSRAIRVNCPPPGG